MPNHLTPAELADALSVPRSAVIANCVRLGVPVHQGRIDRTLYVAAVRADRDGRTGTVARAHRGAQHSRLSLTGRGS